MFTCSFDRPSSCALALMSSRIAFNAVLEDNELVLILPRSLVFNRFLVFVPENVAIALNKESALFGLGLLIPYVS